MQTIESGADMLSAEERGVLIAIATATQRFNGDKRPTPVLWIRAAELDQGALTTCVGRGLVVLWERNRRGEPLADGPLAVLTPYGMCLARVVVTERWRYHVEKKPESEDSPKLIRVRVAEESPYHKTVEFDRYGSLPVVFRRIKLPKHALEIELPCPDLVPDPLPGPLDQAIANEEFMMSEKRRADGRTEFDRETGKAVREEVLVWGQRVKVAKRRLRGKRKKGKAKR